MSGVTDLYCRISQDRDGTGVKVEEQEKQGRALAHKLGLTVRQVWVDNDSSATSGRARPAFEEMLRSHPPALIAWHQDRLLRVSRDLEKVIDLGVNVYFVTAGPIDLSTPTGRAVGRTVAAWSTYEGEHKAERQRSSNRRRAESGAWQFSRRPYGYRRVEGQIEIVPDEAHIVREAFRRYLAGETYYALAEDWNRRQVPTLTGTAWSMTTVRAMLRQERYAGLSSYRGERVEPSDIDWEPLISRETWDAYKRMRDQRKRSGSWSTATKHLLSGLIFCDVCGSRMISRPDRGRQVYACGVNWCVSRGAADVEDVVVGVILARLKDPNVVAALRSSPDTAPLEAERATLIARRDDIADLIADGLLSRVKAREKAGELTTRIDVLDRRINAARASSPATDLALAESIPARWDALPLVTRREIVQELGLNVRVRKGRPGARTFNPETVSIGWDGAEGT